MMSNLLGALLVIAVAAPVAWQLGGAYAGGIAVGVALGGGLTLAFLAWQRRLAAVAPDVTYASIEMWIDAENNRPLKARFMAESGRLLKTAYYRRFQPQLGMERPTETVIIDGLDPQSVTLLRFTDYVARPIPEAWLQRDYLPRFQPE